MHNGGDDESERIVSWKSIARYLQCSERTARRWHTSDSLPVRRIGESKQSSVFAYRHELDQWVHNRSGDVGEVARSGSAQSTRLEADTPVARDAVKDLGSWLPASRRALAALGAAGLGALAIGLLMFGGPGRPSGENPRVAVLPFSVFGNAETFLGDGLADDIIGELAQLHEIDVIARTSSFQFRDPADGLEPVAAALGASHVVEGSIQTDGARVRVNARLVDVADNVEIWSDRIEGGADELFNIQHEIALKIAGAAYGNFAPPPAKRRPTDNAEAYALFKRGRMLWAQRGAETVSSAISLFETAVALDPTFAQAWASLAAARLTMPAYATNDQKADKNPARIRTEAERALALDPTLAEAHASLATLATQRGDYIQAETHFQNALREEPSNSTVLFWYAEHLRDLGRLEDARRHMERALTLDPMSTALLQTSAMLYLGYDNNVARRRLQRSWFELGLKGPTGWEGFWVLKLLENDVSGAGEWLAAHPLKVDTRPYALIADAVGDPTTSDDAARKILEAQKRGFPPWTTYHGLHLINQGDQALSILEAEAQGGFFPISHVLFIRWTASSREDPRFWRAMEAMNYVDYWRATEWPDFCRGFRRTNACENLADGLTITAAEKS